MTRTCKLLFIPVFILQACFFLFISRHRFIDGDEGFYLLASRLVMQHKAPYLDFFYTQAPLLPYAYALWFKLTRISWLSARTFSALQTAALGALVYEHVCHETGKWMAAVSAVVLFASCALVFCWYPIVKTFSLAVLFLFLAYIIVTRVSPSSSGWRLAAAGFFFGLSVDTRSYVVIVAPLFVWWILRESGSRKLAHLLWAVAGFLVGIVPSLVLFFASPGVYLFNNLGFHATRSESGLVGDWQGKAQVLAEAFTGRVTGFQLSLLLLTCMAMIAVRRRKRDAALLAFLIALLLGIVSILPTPALPQYFAIIAPFLVVAAVCSVSDFLDSLQSQRTVRMAGAACIVLLVSFVVFAVPGLRRYLVTGYQVPGIASPADAPNWALRQVTAVSNAIDQLARPSEPVVSFWPGYIFASRADPYPGYENNFGIYIAERLTPEQRSKYHVLTRDEIYREFAFHQPRLAVIGNQGPRSGGPPSWAAEAMAERSGYRLARTVGDTLIYQCCTGPAYR
jgi:hypothetical protein